MSEHPNETIVRRFYDAFSTGDAETLGELSAPDLVWSVPGDSPISGDHKGQEEVFAMFARAGELSGGTVRVELQSLDFKDDGTVITRHRVTGERGDKKLDVMETDTWTIEDGKVVRVLDVPDDQAAADDFYA